ncbi:MAG TPA: hypothetical protein VFU07_05310 [Candidatus Lumbricidophila sp.]|nr:hypothetical protein [Candidatus Lumbricidophila sp.]
MATKATKVRITDVLRSATGLPLKTSRELAQCIIDEFDLFEKAESLQALPRPIAVGEVWRHIDQEILLEVTEVITEPVKITDAITSWEDAWVHWSAVDPANTANGVVSIDKWRDQCEFVANNTTESRTSPHIGEPDLFS